MNERLTTRSLAEILAEQAGINEKRAEEFIEAFSSYITQGIEKNKFVKVTGLGIFKVVLVRERESVHIQTGERFVIPAHHKLSYVPDKDFKEHINRQFSFFEPVETDSSGHDKKGVSTVSEIINEDAVKEPKKRPAPIVVVEDSTPPVTEVNPEYSYLDSILEQEASSEVSENATPLISEDIIVPDAVEEALEETSDNADIPDFINEDVAAEGILENSIEPENLEKSPVEEEDVYITTRKESNSVPFWRWFPLLLLFVAVGVGAGTFAFLYYSSPNKNVPYNEDIVAIVPEVDFEIGSQTPLPIGTTLDFNDEYSDSTSVDADNIMPENDWIQEELGASNEEKEADKKEEKPVIDWLAPTTNSAKKETRRADRPNAEIENRNRNLPNNTTTNARSAGTSGNNQNTTASTARGTAAQSSNKEKIVPARVRLTAGSSLTQIALEYYGDKVFWVYIYEYNKSRIKDYNKIPIGTELRLPLPRTYGINAKSQSSIEKAKQRQAQLLRSGGLD